MKNMRMRLCIFHFWIILIVLCVLVIHIKALPLAYNKECQVWQNISQSIEEEQNVVVQCQSNSECSGTDCIGKYSYQGPLAEYFEFEKEFCIGIVVEACSQPTNVQMYVVMLSGNNSEQETDVTVSSSQQIPINGPGISIMGISAHIFMDIKMNHTVIYDQPHIFFSASLEVKLSGRSFFGSSFAERLNGVEVVLVRDMYIPVPPCDPRIGNHTRVSGKCRYDTISQLKRTGPNTTCAVGSMNSCSNHEMCEDKICVCLPGYEYNEQLHQCSKSQVPTYEITEDESSEHSSIDKKREFSDESSKHSSIDKKHIIIIVCSIVGFLVLVAIVATSMVKCKRHRERYGQHEMILQESDDPEVDE